MFPINTTVKIVKYSKSVLIGQVAVVVEEDEKFVVVNLNGAVYLFLPSEVEAI